jgi:hypothetical protein
MNQIQPENMPKIEIDLKSSDFDKLFLESLDHTFFMLLGESAKEAFFSFLYKKYALNKQDIPGKMEDFVKGLEQIFGSSSALLELALMKELRRGIPSFNCVLEDSDLSFESYVASIKYYVENF